MDRITPIPRPTAGTPPVNSAAAWTCGPQTTSPSASRGKPALTGFSLLVLGVLLPAQPAPVIRDLFPTKAITACALPVREVTDRGAIYQVFSKRGAPQELFRLRVGRHAGGQVVKWWSYGIQNCGDFNRDSILDYTWYGGDDTGHEHFLLLSNPSGPYKKISIERTLQHHWARTRRDIPPDFGAVGDFDIQRVTLEYAVGKLILHIAGQRWAGPQYQKISMDVDDADWVAEP
jgi:hypothetical protein